MNSPIDRLEREFWDSCVTQRPAQNQESIDRWQTDELSHLKERFFVHPMPVELNTLVQDALIQWQKIEKKVCSSLGINREYFLNEFEKAREDFHNRGKEWQRLLTSLQPSVYGAVRNMDWVNLFSWVLPNADKQHSEEHRKTGRMVTAVFYIELLSKYGNDYQNGYLKKIEARWHLVNQYSDVNSTKKVTVKELVNTFPRTKWPHGMPTSIDSKLVIIGVSYGNSSVEGGAEVHEQFSQADPNPTDGTKAHQDFFYPDSTNYWKKVRMLSTKFMSIDNPGISENDALQKCSHFNLGLGSAGNATEDDVDEDIVEWVSYLVNSKLSPKLIVLFGLWKILNDKKIADCWNHTNGLQIDWSTPARIVYFKGYNKKKLKYRIWEATDKTGNQINLIMWPNHPSRPPFTSLDFWQKSIDQLPEIIV